MIFGWPENLFFNNDCEAFLFYIQKSHRTAFVCNVIAKLHGLNNTLYIDAELAVPHSERNEAYMSALLSCYPERVSYLLDLRSNVRISRILISDEEAALYIKEGFKGKKGFKGKILSELLDYNVFKSKSRGGVIRHLVHMILEENLIESGQYALDDVNQLLSDSHSQKLLCSADVKRYQTRLSALAQKMSPSNLNLFRNRSHSSMRMQSFLVECVGVILSPSSLLHLMVQKSMMRHRLL